MCSPKVGLQTGDVDLFVRKWFECSTENLCLNNVIMKEKSGEVFFRQSSITVNELQVAS